MKHDVTAAYFTDLASPVFVIGEVGTLQRIRLSLSEQLIGCRARHFLPYWSFL